MKNPKKNRLHRRPRPAYQSRVTPLENLTNQVSDGPLLRSDGVPVIYRPAWLRYSVKRDDKNKPYISSTTRLNSLFHF